MVSPNSQSNIEFQAICRIHVHLRLPFIVFCLLICTFCLTGVSSVEILQRLLKDAIMTSSPAMTPTATSANLMSFEGTNNPSVAK